MTTGSLKGNLTRTGVAFGQDKNTRTIFREDSKIRGDKLKVWASKDHVEYARRHYCTTDTTKTRFGTGIFGTAGAGIAIGEAISTGAHTASTQATSYNVALARAEAKTKRCGASNRGSGFSKV